MTKFTERLLPLSHQPSLQGKVDMESFSSRYGYKNNQIMQIESLDESTRNRLYIHVVHECGLIYTFGSQDDSKVILFWSDFLQEKIASIDQFIDTVEYFFSSGAWNEIMDCIEFVYKNFFSVINSQKYRSGVNQIFEENLVGYRLVNGFVVPITNQTEIDEIMDAVNTDVSTASDHINSAIKLFSERRNPDYHNIIKESISAVEAMLRFVTKRISGTLGYLLDELSKKHQIDPELRKGWKGIYGFVSNRGGIRHSKKPADTEVDFNDAKYFLVISSAFVNYLKSKLVDE